MDPARATQVDFSAPYVAIDGTYMVRSDSPLTRLDQFDRPGLRIAVGNKSAYDLWLTRNARQSEPLRVVTSQDGVRPHSFSRQVRVDQGARDRLMW